jgi:hypothetical protein
MLITRVFTYKGQKETAQNAYEKLIALNPTDKYNKQKAAGALGGAARWGFIVFTSGVWKRMR